MFNKYFKLLEKSNTELETINLYIMFLVAFQDSVFIVIG